MSLRFACVVLISPLFILQSSAIFTGTPGPAPTAESKFGPWIVTLENSHHDHDEFERTARTAAESYATRMHQHVEAVVPFRVKRSIKNVLNAIVVEGITKEDLLSLPGTQDVETDSLRYPAEYSWGLDRIDQSSLPLSQTPYSPTYRGCGVDAYIIDTGINTLVSEFQAVSGVSREVANVWNCCGAVAANQANEQTHGTHVAGTVGGNTVGVAPCANLYGLSVFAAGSNEAYMSDIIAAIDFVTTRHTASAGKKSVINMSLGGPGGSSAEETAVNNAVNAGVVVVVAGGNEAQDACTTSPAGIASAITVAASGITDTLAGFSNYGSCIDIVAPGVDIVSQLPDGSYAAYDGTSMASPHVAGLAAQYLEKAGTVTKTVDEVRTAIICDARMNIISLGRVAERATPNVFIQVPSSGVFSSCSSPTMQPVVSSRPTSPAVYCDAYSTSNTFSATINYVSCFIRACPSAVLSISACDGSANTCSGDQYIVLVDENGNSVSYNDDSCGLCSGLQYYPDSCQTFTLRQGCYSNEACSGRFAVTGGEVIGSSSRSPVRSPSKAPTRRPTTTPPTRVPTRRATRAPTRKRSPRPTRPRPTASPTRRIRTGTPVRPPTNSPTSPSPAPTPAIQFCAPYSASNTASATVNTSTCYVYGCPTSSIQVSACVKNSTCIGDQLIRVFGSDDVLVAVNDDSCGLCSSVEFTPQTCDYFAVQEGCYSDRACGGRLGVMGGSVVSPPPTATPTFSPTLNPTVTSIPTAATTLAREPDSYCDFYSTSNTFSATLNTVPCYISACPSTTLLIQPCTGNLSSCTGDQYIRLMDSSGIEVAYNDDGGRCGGGYCSVIQYTPLSCQTFTLNQGCFSSSSCQGRFGVTGGTVVTPAPSAVPVRAPSRAPTRAVGNTPTRRPTRFRTQIPTQGVITPSRRPSRPPVTI